MAPGLMIPDFSVAISSTVDPRSRVWSMATGVITATCPSATLVASQVPPRPTSTTATSTGASANAAYPSTTDSMKKLSRLPPSATARWSTSSTTGSTSS